MSINLSDIGERKALARRIKDDIDEWTSRTYDDGPRSHLGASVVGQDCPRAAWYAFRWFNYVRPSGRMSRLFRRGHLEELRFLEYLRGIGFVVDEHDPETGKQFRCTGVNGHFGGSCDGQNQPPERYGLPQGTRMLCEFKTKGTGSGFTKLSEKGIAVANYQHYCQMCVYGWKMQIKFALYMVVNKNDDDLYVEIVELDWNLAQDLERKAGEIIQARVPPAKLGMSEAHFKCKGCDFISVCHRDHMPRRNCRSCVHSWPIENGQWGCDYHKSVIPKEYAPHGCDNWERLA